MTGNANITPLAKTIPRIKAGIAKIDRNIAKNLVSPQAILNISLQTLKNNQPLAAMDNIPIIKIILISPSILFNPGHISSGHTFSAGYIISHRIFFCQYAERFYNKICHYPIERSEMM